MRHIIIAYRPLMGEEPEDAPPFTNQCMTPDIFEHKVEVSPHYQLHYVSYESKKGLDHTAQEFETHSTNVFNYIISLTGKITETKKEVLVLLHVGKNNHLSFDGKDLKKIKNARIGTFMSLHGPVYKNIVHSNGFFVFDEAPRPKVEMLDEIWDYYDLENKRKTMLKKNS